MAGSRPFPAGLMSNHSDQSLQGELEVRDQRRLGGVRITGSTCIEDVEMFTQRPDGERPRRQPVQSHQRHIVFEPLRGGFDQLIA